MKIDWSAFTTNPVYQVGGIIAVLILVGIIAGSQKACADHHEQAASHAAAVADTHHAQIQDLKNQLAAKDKIIADREQTARKYKALYEARKTAALEPLPPLPPSNPALAASLQELGLRPGVQVTQTEASTLSEADAQLTWIWAQEAERGKRAEAARAACDVALQATEEVNRELKLKLDLSARALETSQAEANARNEQAQELTKALKVERGKTWQKWALGAAGVVVGGYAARH